MNKSDKIKKLEELLKIPISDIDIYDSNVQIISNGIAIGGIPCYHIAGVTTFDSNPDTQKWLKWDLVYEGNKHYLDKIAKDLFSCAKGKVSIGTFRKLYLRSEKGDFLGSLECSFENGKWECKKEN